MNFKHWKEVAMTSKKPSRQATKGKQAKGSSEDVPRSGSIDSLPAGAVAIGDERCYRYTYTTGPFSLPLKTHSLDWGILNNDSSPQKVRITVFKCPIAAVKTAEPPGPLEVTLNPGVTFHNANKATGGFFYEIQVECNSQLVFPYTSAWPGAIADPMPGSVVNSAGFIRSMS
jgi:hypothetical protein